MRATLKDAVSEVDDGSVVYIGNFGAQLFAVGHELVKQGKRDLHVIAPSGGILIDELIAEGVTSSVTVSHCWNPIGPTATVNFRAAVESGKLDLRELSFGALCSAFAAGAGGFPFMPTTDLRPTGYFTENRSGGLLDVVQTRFGETVVVGAIVPDIAFLHVDRASDSGDAWINQPFADVVTVAQASRRTFVIAEEICAHEEYKTVAVSIPSLLVDSVIHCPGSVFPDGASGRYGRDIEMYQRYASASRNRSDLAAWRASVDKAALAHV